MDFMRAAQYPFEDEEWANKVLIGALISMVPILNFAATGYMVEIIRNVAHDQPRPLPKWDRVSDFFIKGLYLVLAQLAYGFVLAVLVSVLALPLFSVLPMLGSGDEDVFAALGGLALVGLICLNLVVLVLGVAAALMLMAATIRFSVGWQELYELFDFKANFEFLREHIAQVLLAILYIVVFALIIMIPLACINIVLGLIPLCGQLVAFAISLAVGFLIMLFSAHICGQLARQAGLVTLADAPGV